MVENNLRKLDLHLSKYDFDSLDWADGGANEISKDLLNHFTEQEWDDLNISWRKKDRMWRGCLISSLGPSMGGISKVILIQALDDPDPEVSFLALSSISFYCGINDGQRGPFVDANITNVQFKNQVSKIDGILKKIRNISQSCAPRFQARFDLLSRVLAGDKP